MDCIEAIFTRRSIRKYTSKKVSDEQIETLLKAGMYAPSAVNKQPWEFVVIKKHESLLQVIEAHQSATMLKQCSVAILICLNEKEEHAPGYGIQDCAAATQNILLAAHGIGLAAVWLGIYPRMGRVEALTKIFKLPEGIVPISLISIGYGDETKGDPQRFDPKKVHTETW